MRRWLTRGRAAMAVLVGGAAALVGPAAIPGGPATPALAGAPPALAGYHTVPDGTAGKVAGAAIENLSTDSLTEVLSAAQQMKAAGMNTMELDDWWQTDSATSNSVEPSANTTPDALLEAEIETAEAAGLQVTLTPVLYCNGCEGGFRGVMQPSNRPAFFASYSAFIDHYASVAESYGVTTLFVGSEMSSLEGDTAAWDSVISSARRLFHGTIAYEEDWAVLGQAHFLGAVDEIGVSAYFPLDGAASPGLGALLSDWRSSSMAGWRGRNWVSALAQIAARYRRPIVFGEAGYLSGDYAGAQPFLNYYSTPNEGLQADLYQALLETFEPYSWWKGVVWWDWSATPDAAADNGRTFAGKGAEVMLACWYGQGMRPDDPATALP